MSSLVRTLSLVGLIGSSLTMLAVPSQNADAQKPPKKLIHKFTRKPRPRNFRSAIPASVWGPLNQGRPNPVTLVLYNSTLLGGSPAGTTLKANKHYYAQVVLNDHNGHFDGKVVLKLKALGYDAVGNSHDVTSTLFPTSPPPYYVPQVSWPYRYIKIYFDSSSIPYDYCTIDATAQLLDADGNPKDPSAIARWTYAQF